jgi:hypothetical protein
MGLFAGLNTAGDSKTGRAIGVVTNSVEFARIFGLPRRTLDLSAVQDVTPVFHRPAGTMSFWPIQSAALIEAAKADGLFAPIGVGFGKTLITLALPTAMDSKNAVLLVPPQLKKKTLWEIENVYGDQFDLPIKRLTIIAYSELSSAKNADILEYIEPDLIIADEAHALRHRTSARTKRFLRYMKENPACRFAALSGTMTTRSIVDYAHLIELALRKNSPLPRGYREVKDWTGALDVNPEAPARPGVLKKFCEPGEHVRDGYRRRMVETEGVVATSESELGTGLVIQKTPIAVPDDIEMYLEQVNKTWSIAGEEFESAIALARALRQVSCGFYYRWEWPDDEPDTEWLTARADWHKEVRERLKRSLRGQDSPLLCAQAAERHYKWEEAGGKGKPPENSWASKSWFEWRLHKDKKPPPTKPIWLNDFVVREAISWSKRQDAPAIIWYEHRAVGEEIARVSGLPLYGAGTDASHERSPVIVCSIRTQGTGKNLQHYARNLFTSLPPNGTTFEQCAGRTHRPGQQADEVMIDWFGHTETMENSMAKVIDDALYMQQTTGHRQKVLYATRISASDNKQQ